MKRIFYALMGAVAVLIKFILQFLLTTLAGALFFSVYILPFLGVIYFSDEGFTWSNVLYNAAIYCSIWVCYYTGRLYIIPKISETL